MGTNEMTLARFTHITDSLVLDRCITLQRMKEEIVQKLNLSKDEHIENTLGNTWVIKGTTKGFTMDNDMDYELAISSKTCELLSAIDIIAKALSEDGGDVL